MIIHILYRLKLVFSLLTEDFFGYFLLSIQVVLEYSGDQPSKVEVHRWVKTVTLICRWVAYEYIASILTGWVDYCHQCGLCTIQVAMSLWSNQCMLMERPISVSSLCKLVGYPAL